MASRVQCEDSPRSMRSACRDAVEAGSAHLSSLILSITVITCAVSVWSVTLRVCLNWCLAGGLGNVKVLSDGN